MWAMPVPADHFRLTQRAESDWLLQETWSEQFPK